MLEAMTMRFIGEYSLISWKPSVYHSMKVFGSIKKEPMSDFRGYI
jgi:hypothetical protein